MIDISNTQDLTPKSRGILYCLKSALKKNNIQLDIHIQITFDQKKKNFNKKQFHKIIRAYDNDLLLDEIDDLFDELDCNQNGVVLYDHLLKIFTKINEEDNPAQSLNKKTLIMNDQSQQTKFAIELKDKLLATPNYLQWINIFDPQNMGYLNRESMREIMKSLDIENQIKQQLTIDYLLAGKKSIKVDELFAKLDLDTNAKRVKLENLKATESVFIQQEQISEFIKKEKLKTQSKLKFGLEESLMMDSMLDSTTYNFQNIPQCLVPYFNYSSQLDEPLKQLACEYIENKTIFFDPDNPSSSKNPAWVHIAELMNDKFYLFKQSQSLIRRDNLRKGLAGLMEPKDIIQGSFGDCYFLSAVAAIVELYPELVYNLFVFEKNPAHIYGVRLFLDGVWKTQILDGCFPVTNHGQFTGAQPHNRKIWVMLLEKAWAKSFKSFDNIHSGYNEEGMIAVSGAPTLSVSSRKEGFLRTVEAYLKKGAIITCATSRDVHQLTKEQQEYLGVFSSHAYTFLKAYVDLPYQNHKVTLIKIRNPWGRKGWKGDWSFNDNKWTKNLRDLLNYNVDSKDGTFFIALDDFIMYFDHINICKVNLAYVNSWVKVNSSRYEFYQTSFYVEQPGDYFFTIYQDNPRKYKNKGTYEKSKSWFFLMKLGEKKDAIASSAIDLHDNTIQTTLEPGQYQIVCKVSWKFFEEHQFVITSYGPAKIKFSPPKVTDTYPINDFIDSKSEMGMGEVTLFHGDSASRRTYFSHREGFGFICLTNHSNSLLNTKINLNPFKGIVVLHPYSLPLDLTIFPYESVVCKFLVDPKGFSYKMHFH